MLSQLNEEFNVACHINFKLNKMKFFLFLSLLFVPCFAINAQVASFYNPYIMQIEDGKNVKEYALVSYTHSITPAYSDSEEPAKMVVYIYMSASVESIDDFFIKWVSDPTVEKDGKIINRDERSGKIQREFSFKGAKISAYSESFNFPSYSTIEQATSSFDITVKEFSINSIPIKTKD